MIRKASYLDAHLEFWRDCRTVPIPPASSSDPRGSSNSIVDNTHLSRDRTPELEHGAMWEIEHIRLLPLRTQQAVFCRANGAV